MSKWWKKQLSTKLQNSLLKFFKEVLRLHVLISFISANRYITWASQKEEFRPELSKPCIANNMKSYFCAWGKTYSGIITCKKNPWLLVMNVWVSKWILYWSVWLDVYHSCSANCEHRWCMPKNLSSRRGNTINSINLLNYIKRCNAMKCIIVWC